MSDYNMLLIRNQPLNHTLKGILKNKDYLNIGTRGLTIVFAAVSQAVQGRMRHFLPHHIKVIRDANSSWPSQ